MKENLEKELNEVILKNKQHKKLPFSTGVALAGFSSAVCIGVEYSIYSNAQGVFDRATMIMATAGGGIFGTLCSLWSYGVDKVANTLSEYEKGIN